MERNLFDLLVKVQLLATDSFSGIGIIMHSDISCLPIFPMNQYAKMQCNKICTPEFLVEIADINSQYHDGFHLLSQSWTITHISQYFSPSIAKDVAIGNEENKGGRFYAALFGSIIPGVICTGIISMNYGIVVFKNGNVVCRSAV